MNQKVPRRERLTRIQDMLAQGYTKTQIAKALGISRKTLYQDLDQIQEQAVAVVEASPVLAGRIVEQNLDVVSQLQAANQAAWELLESYKDNKPYVALGALERIQEQLTLQAKLIGLIASGPQINILQIQNFSKEVYEVIQEVACPACKARILEGLKARRDQYRK